METFFRGLLFSLLFSFVCGGGIEGKIRYGVREGGKHRYLLLPDRGGSLVLSVMLMLPIARERDVDARCVVPRKHRS